MTEEQRRELHNEGVENSVEGKAKDMRGHAKDAIGGLTGNESLQAEGQEGPDRRRGPGQAG